MQFKEVMQVLISSCKNQFLMSIGRATFQFCVLAQPIVYGFILGMMYIDQSSEAFTTYVLIGSGILTFWSSICFSSASDINRERFYGTLENIFIAPGRFEWIILGKILGNTIWGMISMGVSAGFVMIFFDKALVILDLWLLVVGVIMMMISFIAIAFMLAGLFTLSRSARILMNCMEHPIYILCGIVFPIELLPKFLLPISYALSPTWAVKVIRLAVYGGTHAQVLNSVTGLMSITLVYILIAFSSFRMIDHKARVDATLGVY